METLTNNTTASEMKPFEQLAYSRPDMGELEIAYKTALATLENATSVQEQLSAIEQLNTLRLSFETQMTLVSIRHTVDTRDEFYEAEQNFFDENGPIVSGLTNQYYRTILNSPFREQLEAKLGKQLFALAELNLNTFSPEVLKDLQKENALSSEYTKLMASSKVEFDGKELTLSELTPYTLSTDREVRKNAQATRFGWLQSKEAELDKLYDDLVKLRTNIAQKLGYNSFTELAYARLTRSDYDAAQVKYYREQILEHVVPVCNKLRERQAARLGLDSLKYYDEDFEFTSGNAQPKGLPEWIVEHGKRMYRELSPETDEFFSFMTDYNLLDLVSKKGKAPGGYCTFLPQYRAPFIYSNFNGTSGDIDVLTHEAGHAFQIYSSRNFETPEYYWPTYEACEIHSMSMEYFAWPWMELFFEGDADKYKFSHISSMLTFLPYGAAVDEFQHAVYDKPEMTPAERKQTWVAIEKKYLPHRDYDGVEYLEQGGYWQRQTHIYNGPFYYIDYTLAQICALQFWAKAQAGDEAAWPDYLRLCQAGGSKPFLELVKLANLQSPFKPNCVKDVVGKAEAWLDTIDDKSL